MRRRESEREREREREMKMERLLGGWEGGKECGGSIYI